MSGWMKALSIAFLMNAPLLWGTGCDAKPKKVRVVTYNREVEERVFLACLKSLPQGPSHLTASGNDWDEVVEQCRIAAASIAREEKYVLEGREP